MFYDFIVIGLYFILILAIGVVFSKMASKSTSDYFRGGGRMLWWMVGSTAFMAQFSAVTFTGAAGKAFARWLCHCGRVYRQHLRLLLWLCLLLPSL